MHDPLTFTLGLLLIVLSVPLVLRWVPPNRLYGLRLRVTRQDPWVWYEANAATGRDYIVIGALLVIGAFLPADPTVRLIALIGGVLLVTVAGVLRAFRLRDQRRSGDA